MNLNNKNIQIVVARYNENIKYLNVFRNIVIIYNKGIDDIPSEYNSIKLPNIGRESHTYLYHIIQNYDNLANKTLFIQGRISDHKILPIVDYFKDEDFIGNIHEHGIILIKNRIIHSGKYLNDLNSGNLIKSKYSPFEWMKVIGLNMNDSIIFRMVWGANFSLSKKKILEKPKIFYQNLLKYLEYHNNPEEGHFFERSWYSIFNHNKWFENKKIILFHSFNKNNITNNFLERCLDILMKNGNIDEIHLWGLNISSPVISLKYIFNENYYKIHNLNYLNSNEIHLDIDIIYGFDFYIKFISHEHILNDTICIEYHFYNNKIELLYNNIIIEEYIYNSDYLNKNIKIYYDDNHLILEINNNILIKTFIYLVNNLKEYYLKNTDKIGVLFNNNIDNSNPHNHFLKKKFNNIYIFNAEINNIFYKEHYENYDVLELIDYIYQ